MPAIHKESESLVPFCSAVCMWRQPTSPSRPEHWVDVTHINNLTAPGFHARRARQPLLSDHALSGLFQKKRWLKNAPSSSCLNQFSFTSTFTANWAIQSQTEVGVLGSPALINITSRGSTNALFLSPSTQMAEPEHSPRLDLSLASRRSQELTRSGLSWLRRL